MDARLLFAGNVLGVVYAELSVFPGTLLHDAMPPIVPVVVPDVHLTDHDPADMDEPFDDTLLLSCECHSLLLPDVCGSVGAVCVVLFVYPVAHVKSIAQLPVYVPVLGYKLPDVVWDVYAHVAACGSHAAFALIVGHDTFAK